MFVRALKTAPAARGTSVARSPKHPLPGADILGITLFLPPSINSGADILGVTLFLPPGMKYFWGGYTFLPPSINQPLQLTGVDFLNHCS